MAKRNYKSKPALAQLSGDGSTVETLMSGSQRVYSREDTMQMIQMARSADTPGKLLELGKFVMQATKAQDARPPQFTNE